MKGPCIAGRRFGRLVAVVEVDPLVKPYGNMRRYNCLCDCGEWKIARRDILLRGHCLSCGCIHTENVDRKRNGATNESGKMTHTYRTWLGIRKRCHDPSSKSYRYYGARGIHVHPAWSTYAGFLADMGERPMGLTIERIDNSKGYEPGNCRWATMIEQARNKTTTVLNAERVSRIRAQYLMGMRQSDIALGNGVSRAHVSEIIHGRQWREVLPAYAMLVEPKRLYRRGQA